MSLLEPGLELDKLIAEKVLGWYRKSDIGGPRDWWLETGKEWEGTLHLNRFSTDIKAAWDLAEKFQLCIVPYNDGQWTAVKKGMIFVDGEKHAAKTAAHAICLAALSEVEKDYEIKYSTDDLVGEPGERESRRYYIKTSNGYELYQHTLTEYGKYELVVRTIDGYIADLWLKGELIISRYSREEAK